MARPGRAWKRDVPVVSGWFLGGSMHGKPVPEPPNPLSFLSAMDVPHRDPNAETYIERTFALTHISGRSVAVRCMWLQENDDGHDSETGVQWFDKHA